MKDKINSIDLNGKLDHEEIYYLYKTDSSEANIEISGRIDTFKHNMEFFEYYANKDIKNLLNIFDLKLSENNDEYFPSFKSDIEQYISCISQIILSIKLLLKTQDVLSKTFVITKNQLSKLKNENKLENYNQDYLFLYLESLLKCTDQNFKIYSNDSVALSSNISSLESIPKYSLFRKAFSENKLNDFSSDEMEPIIFDNTSTPRFDSDEESENQEKINSNLDSIELHSAIKKGTLFTFSEYVFAEETSTPKNYETKLISTPVVKPKIKTSTNVRMSQSKDTKKIKHNRHVFSETNVIIKNNNKKNHCRNLLEMINIIYKKGLINSEEKVKLKQLVIEKSKKIEYFYYNIFKNAKNDKNKLLFEVKKILD